MEIIHLIGQVLFGGYFVSQGINHFKNSKALVGYASARKIPNPSMAVFFTGVLLLLGGLGVLLYGFIPYTLTAISFILLLVFLIPVTFMMHSYWKLTDPQEKMIEMVNFMKNLALIGAVLSMMYW